MKKLITLTVALILITGLTNLSHAQWPGSTTANVLVTNTPALDEYAGFNTKSAICTDDSGGAITCWYYQNLTNQPPYEIHAARIDNHGVVRWSLTVCAAIGTTGRDNPTIVSDDAGGAIVVWGDWRDSVQFHPRNIYAARIGPNGNFIWGGGNGIIVDSSSNANKYTPVICSDGSNGAIVAYVGSTNSPQIFAKHIHANGTLSWGSAGAGAGLALVNVNSIVHDNTAITSDGLGGAIIAWEDWGTGGADHNIYASRVNAAGTIV